MLDQMVKHFYYFVGIADTFNYKLRIKTLWFKRYIL